MKAEKDELAEKLDQMSEEVTFLRGQVKDARAKAATLAAKKMITPPRENAIWRMTQNLQNLAPFDYGAGLIVAFYVISATVLAPKIGVANFIVMAVSSQILFSLMIDHFGLFGAPVKPISMIQLFGAVMLLIGLATTQLASSKIG